MGWLEVAKNVLTVDEGRKNRPYRDSLGNWTIGVGYFIGPSLDDLYLPNEVVDLMLKEKIENHLEDLTTIFPKFDSFEVPRQMALLSMMYSMGKNKFLSFKNLIAAVNNREWGKASIEAVKSQWASQVGIRADRISYMLSMANLHSSYL